MAVELKNEARYIDLAKWFEKQKSYSDFEGLASGEGLEKAADDALGDRGLRSFPEDKEVAELIKSLLIHLMFEDRDQADVEPDHNINLTRVDTLLRILGSRYWMRYDAGK